MFGLNNDILPFEKLNPTMHENYNINLIGIKLKK